jgi:hypothetical protein
MAGITSLPPISMRRSVRTSRAAEEDDRWSCGAGAWGRRNHIALPQLHHWPAKWACPFSCLIANIPLRIPSPTCAHFAIRTACDICASAHDPARQVWVDANRLACASNQSSAKRVFARSPKRADDVH